MTDNVIYGIDFHAKDRQAEIERFSLAVVDEALNGIELPADFPNEYRAPDDSA